MKYRNYPLSIGQIVQTIADEIAVPYLPKHKRGLFPCIRLVESVLAEVWYINTDNQNQQKGLVCFVAPEYCGRGILSVEITTIEDCNVFARPIQWVESDPKLILDDAGMSKLEILEHPNYKTQLKEAKPVLSSDTTKP